MCISEAISIRINEILCERNMSLYQLEQITGIPHSTMSCVMSIRYDSVNLKTVFLIIKGLNMNINEFFNPDLFNLDELLVEY